MIKVTLKIQDVDYAAAVDTLAPVLLEKLSGSAHPIASLLLGKATGLSTTAAKAALEVLPQGMKDDLAAACLNHYSAEISQAIANLAAQKDIYLCVEGVGVAVWNDSGTA